jgi:hypothetical protein
MLLIKDIILPRIFGAPLARWDVAAAIPEFYGIETICGLMHNIA